MTDKTSKETLLQIPSVLKERYQIVKKLGGGGFGEIYEGRILETGQSCAVKAESNMTPKQVLKMEAAVLRKLQNMDCTYACQFLGAGKTDKVNYVVMTLLGSNLSELRKKQPEGRFTWSTTFRLAVQMLRGIQAVHDCGFLHRDIKPSNFAMGSQSATRHVCYILDFGLARQYITATGEIRDPRPIAGFRGTVRYASINAHRSVEMGRHDDIWSLFYMLMEFLHGQLPWRRLKEKEDVAKEKEAFDHREFLIGLPEEFEEMLEHLESLDYYAAPEYALIEHIFTSLIEKYGFSDSDALDWETDLMGSVPSTSGVSHLALRNGPSLERIAEANSEECGDRPRPVQQGTKTHCSAPENFSGVDENGAVQEVVVKDTVVKATIDKQESSLHEKRELSEKVQISEVVGDDGDDDVSEGDNGDIVDGGGVDIGNFDAGIVNKEADIGKSGDVGVGDSGDVGVGKSGDVIDSGDDGDNGDIVKVFNDKGDASVSDSGDNGDVGDSGDNSDGVNGDVGDGEDEVANDEDGGGELVVSCDNSPNVRDDDVHGPGDVEPIGENAGFDEMCDESEVSLESQSSSEEHIDSGDGDGSVGDDDVSNSGDGLVRSTNQDGGEVVNLKASFKPHSAGSDGERSVSLKLSFSAGASDENSSDQLPEGVCPEEVCPVVDIQIHPKPNNNAFSSPSPEEKDVPPQFISEGQIVRSSSEYKDGGSGGGHPISPVVDSSGGHCVSPVVDSSGGCRISSVDGGSQNTSSENDDEKLKEKLLLVLAENDSSQLGPLHTETQPVLPSDYERLLRSQPTLTSFAALDRQGTLPTFQESQVFHHSPFTGASALDGVDRHEGELAVSIEAPSSQRLPSDQEEEGDVERYTGEVGHDGDGCLTVDVTVEGSGEEDGLDLVEPLNTKHSSSSYSEVFEELQSESESEVGGEGQMEKLPGNLIFNFDKAPNVDDPCAKLPSEHSSPKVIGEVSRGKEDDPVLTNSPEKVGPAQQPDHHDNLSVGVTNPTKHTTPMSSSLSPGTLWTLLGIKDLDPNRPLPPPRPPPGQCHLAPDPRRRRFKRIIVKSDL